MRVLLDNCVPRSFERRLEGCEATHCSRLGWERLVNGKLLAAAEEAGFPILITVDRNLQFQQNMSGRKLTVIYLRVPRNDIITLGDMVDPIRERLADLEPGTIVTLVHPDMR